MERSDHRVSVASGRWVPSRMYRGRTSSADESPCALPFSLPLPVHLAGSETFESAHWPLKRLHHFPDGEIGQGEHSFACACPVDAVDGRLLRLSGPRSPFLVSVK